MEVTCTDPSLSVSIPCPHPSSMQDTKLIFIHGQTEFLKRVVVQNKLNVLLKVFWNLHENYNYLPVKQFINDLQKL
jgi:hypothetical protein